MTKTLENNSCFVSALTDYANDPSTGKWSNKQQICKNDLGFDYSTRKLKMRGLGKANQFKFESDSNKPFNIVGWVAVEGAGERV